MRFADPIAMILSEERKVNENTEHNTQAENSDYDVISCNPNDQTQMSAYPKQIMSRSIDNALPDKVNGNMGGQPHETNGTFEKAINLSATKSLTETDKVNKEKACIEMIMDSTLTKTGEGENILVGVQDESYSCPTSNETTGQESYSLSVIVYGEKKHRLSPDKESNSSIYSQKSNAAMHIPSQSSAEKLDVVKDIIKMDNENSISLVSTGNGNYTTAHPNSDSPSSKIVHKDQISTHEKKLLSHNADTADKPISNETGIRTGTSSSNEQQNGKIPQGPVDNASAQTVSITSSTTSQPFTEITPIEEEIISLLRVLASAATTITQTGKVPNQKDIQYFCQQLSGITVTSPASYWGDQISMEMEIKLLLQELAEKASKITQGSQIPTQADIKFFCKHLAEVNVTSSVSYLVSNTTIDIEIKLLLDELTKKTSTIGQGCQNPTQADIEFFREELAQINVTPPACYMNNNKTIEMEIQLLIQELAKKSSKMTLGSQIPTQTDIDFFRNEIAQMNTISQASDFRNAQETEITENSTTYPLAGDCTTKALKQSNRIQTLNSKSSQSKNQKPVTTTDNDRISVPMRGFVLTEIASRCSYPLI